MMLPIHLTTNHKIIVLGIDPGIGRTGYAVLGGNSSNPIIIDLGCIETAIGVPQHTRLQEISIAIKKLLRDYQPSVVALERLFFSKNVKTALQVSEARGVISSIIAEHNLQFFEFSPQEVKISVTGEGGADKKQVQKMLQLIFKIKKLPKYDDTSDALAIALCAMSQLKTMANINA